MQRSLVSIVHVARRAQVSAKTVSRVLNEDASVRPETRRLVKEAMLELGYVPNAAARSLRNSRSRTIGLFLPRLSDAVLAGFIAGAESVVRERAYSLVVADAGVSPEAQLANLRRLFERRVEGLLLYPLGEAEAALQVFRQAKTPVVVLDGGYSRPASRRPRFFVDFGHGLDAAFGYLSNLGHQRIAVFSGSTPFLGAGAKDYERAIGKLDQPIDRAMFLAPHSGDPEERGRRLLSRPDRPTAILAGAHDLAPPLLVAIHRAGLIIPRDISFITVDDSPWARYYRPPLTVLSVDRYECGRLAAEMLFDSLGKGTEHSVTREVKPRLVLRGSCAQPPAASTST